MKSDLVAKACAVARTMEGTTHRRALQRIISDFVALLGEVTDYPAAEFSTDDISALTASAEAVIAHIEQRVSTDDDSPAGQLELVKSVYEIRRQLERVDQWRRHFLGHS